MLNTVIIVGASMVMLVAAAIFIMKTQAETGSSGSEGQGSSNHRQQWGSNHRQPRGSGSSSAGPNARRRPQHSNNSSNQCKICCTENAVMVRLYSCGHSDLCVTCAHKLLEPNKRQCPFCRSRIRGYEEVNTDD